MPSLTSELKRKDSPLRSFFEERLPNTKGILDTATTSPCGFTTRPKRWSQSPREQHREDVYPWSSIGMAFDYRMRYFFEATPAHLLVAYWGALALGKGEVPRSFRELSEAIDDLFGNRVFRAAQLPEAEERLLCRYCFLLGLFEQLYRAGVDSSWGIVRRGRQGGLASIEKLCQEDYVDDLVNLGRLVISRHADLLLGSRHVLNPTFAASRVVPMDGDLIVGDRLIDVKAVKEIGYFRDKSRLNVWQLVGYFLADTNDTYGINELGFYLARQGAQMYWKADDLLAILAGTRVDRTDMRLFFLAACERTRRLMGRPQTVVSEQTVLPERRNSPRIVDLRKIERELLFLPPSAGGGKWHVSCSESGILPAPDGCDPNTTPACGAPVDLNTLSDGVKTQTGEDLQKADSRLCRRCLKYTEEFYVDWVGVLEEHRLQVEKRGSEEATSVERPLSFFPPASGKGKWHVPWREDPDRASWPVPHERQDAPCCGASVLLDRETEPITPVVGQRLKEADKRLCRGCLRYTIITW